MLLHEEQEAKLYLADLPAVLARARNHGAVLLKSRTHEFNERFDLSTLVLTKHGVSLRLRIFGTSAQLTYKSRTAVRGHTVRRREAEFPILSTAITRWLLTLAGFRVIATYEKYRAVYRLGRATVMFDELPLGAFVEIEGDSATIKETARLLGLNIHSAIPSSYLELFSRCQLPPTISRQHLTFSALSQSIISAHDLGVISADSPPN